MDEYNQNWDPLTYYEDESENNDATFQQTFEYCVKPTLSEVLSHIWKLLLLNLIFRLLSQTIALRKTLCHLCSSICGLGILYLVLKSSLPYISIFIIFCYIILLITCQLSSKYSAYILSILCIIYLIGSEFYFPDPDIWIESRGLHMVIAMKVISVAFDIQNGLLKFMPNVIECLGYVLCPSNCLFGPWVSYYTYRQLYEKRLSLLNFYWMKRALISTITAILFLTLSNCWAFWLIPQSWSWTVAYQEALSFRCSHYFISYLSECAMVTGGYEQGSHSNKKENSSKCVVTKPYLIEFPRSLVQVVVYWNIPMHMWLKNYVFRVCKPLGSFIAIIATYLVSSFLHGCNARLAAVLLSLGFYTYVEYKLRHKLSVIFDSCIKANPCKKCSHVYRNHFYVWCVNFAFSLLVIFHLAYLGCLLESPDTYENESNVFIKWQNLSFASHFVTLFIYILYKLI